MFPICFEKYLKKKEEKRGGGDGTKKRKTPNKTRVNDGVIVDKCGIEIHFQLFTHHFNLIFCLLTTSCW